MSVVKRANSQFWYIHFQFNNETFIQSSKTTNKKVAERMEIALKAKVHAEKYLGKKERIKFQAAFALYKQSKKGIASYRNLIAHETVLNRLLPVNKYIDDLTSRDMEGFKNARKSEGVGNEIIKYGFIIIRGTFKHAKKLGYSVSDLEFPTLKLSKGSLRYLKADEEQQLLIELDPKREGKGLPKYEMRSDYLKQVMQDAYDLVVLLLDSGARYSEIANLEWSKVNLLTQTLTVWRSKVNNETPLAMTDRVYAILNRRYESKNSKHVFNNKAGEARGYSTQSIRKAIKRAGLDNSTTHTLRHTLATKLIQNGMSIYEVMVILGHSDINTTMIYSHLEQKQVTLKARDLINQITNASATVGL